MRSYVILVSAGLASAQVVSNGGADLASLLGGNALLNGSSEIDSSAVGFDPAALGIDLNNLNVEGLDFANLDFANQDVIAQGIQGLLGNLCLNGALDFNSILDLGLNNELDLFLQLAQLQQLQQLGFLSLGGIGNLFNSGFALGGFNLGVFKREVANAKKCDGLAAAPQEVAAPAVNDGSVTIATAPDVASVEVATVAAPSVAAATSVAAVASAPAAASTAAAVASVEPTAAPAAAPIAQPVASAAPEAAAPEVAPADVDNLADFTR